MKKQILSTILCASLFLTSIIIPAQAATPDSEIPLKPVEVSSSSAYGYPFDEAVPDDLVPLDTISGDSTVSEDIKVPTEQEAFAIMTALKSEYPEGMPWTNDNHYEWNGGIYIGGYGCAGFCFLLSDAVFGYAPAYFVKEFTYEQIRVGDILRINNDTHSVTIMEKYDDHVVLAEGNYGGKIHWGRTLTRSQVMSTGTYLMSRYPKHVSGDSNCDGEVNLLDAIFAQRAALDFLLLDEQSTANADMNGDGKITVFDAIAIQKLVLSSL